jgi:hypothetical protein
VIGLACRHLLGSLLPPDHFSGGEAPGQANHVLRRLGFTVVLKGGPAVGEEQDQAGKDWSADEVAALVADYFDMLRLELLGQRYSKAAHRKALLGRLSRGRTGPAVEFKHANLSAVLVGLGLPYIGGYKPRGNYQQLLADVAEAYLDRSPNYLSGLAEAPVLNPDRAPPAALDNPDALIEAPPERLVLPPPGKPWLSRRGRRLDFAERDAANRRLGRLGEELVLELERRRLVRAGRDDLAAKVEWVANTVGDGLGFDVLSFDTDDEAERFLEVKTTGLPKHFPFRVTATEVRCSEDVPEKFRLYRVFDFGRSPRVYVLNGSLRQACCLEPTVYLAAL